jgi:hypothetical protein
MCVLCRMGIYVKEEPWRFLSNPAHFLLVTWVGMCCGAAIGLSMVSLAEPSC